MGQLLALDQRLLCNNRVQFFLETFTRAKWLIGFDEKAQRPGVEDYQCLELTVAGYPPRMA